MPASTYNPYIAPTGGQGPYGMVPGQIGIPNPYADLAGAFPALGKANELAGSDLLAKLGGDITPGTRNALKLAAAQFDQGRGTGLSGLGTNQLFGNIAGFAENQAQQGLQDYSSLIPTISKTQTVDPSLLTEIAARNALYAAAPDPSQAQNLAQKLFSDYLAGMRGPGGGTVPTQGVRTPAGGTGDMGIIGGDTRGINYGGTTYYGGATPAGADARWASANPWAFQGSSGAGGGGVGLGEGLPTTDWTTSSNPFAPTGGEYNPLADTTYGAGPYNPLADVTYPVTNPNYNFYTGPNTGPAAPTPGVYMGENPNLPTADFWLTEF